MWKVLERLLEKEGEPVAVLPRRMRFTSADAPAGMRRLPGLSST
jgi:hypothetical protein